MFAVLDVKTKKKSRWEKLSESFRKPEISFDEIFLREGKSFLICHTEYHKGKIPTDAILEKTPVEFFILPHGFEKKDYVREYEPAVLPEVMLFNSAVKYISESCPDPIKNRIILVDRKGIHTEKTERLISLASSVTVVTNEEESYKPYAEKLMTQYGASVVVRRETVKSFTKRDFIFDYEGTAVPLSFPGTAFSKEKKNLLSGRVLTPGGFSMPYPYEKLWVKNTNKLHFASALYELCEIRELQNLSFNELCG